MTSSETSTDASFRPWHFFVLASLMAATAAVVMSGHPQPANLILVSLTIATAGLAGFGCYRMVAPLTLDDARPSAESLGARARAGLAREKMLVLRSIKELEFDRAMGKVSESDFDEMAARLRARAITLMKQLDETEGGYRQLIEQEVAARLRHAGGKAGAAPAAAAVAEPAPSSEAPPDGDTAQAGACPACGTANDRDARFCKQCGGRLSAS